MSYFLGHCLWSVVFHVVNKLHRETWPRQRYCELLHLVCALVLFLLPLLTWCRDFLSYFCSSSRASPSLPSDRKCDFCIEDVPVTEGWVECVSLFSHDWGRMIRHSFLMLHPDVRGPVDRGANAGAADVLQSMGRLCDRSCGEAPSGSSGLDAGTRGATVWGDHRKPLLAVRAHQHAEKGGDLPRVQPRDESRDGQWVENFISYTLLYARILHKFFFFLCWVFRFMNSCSSSLQCNSSTNLTTWKMNSMLVNEFPLTEPSAEVLAISLWNAKRMIRCLRSLQVFYLDLAEIDFCFFT